MTFDFTSSSHHHALKCPLGVDESVFMGLPEDIQREVIAQYREQQQEEVRQVSDNVPVHCVESSDHTDDAAVEEQKSSRAHNSPRRRSTFYRHKAKVGNEKAIKEVQPSGTRPCKDRVKPFRFRGELGKLEDDRRATKTLTPDQSRKVQCVIDTKERSRYIGDHDTLGQRTGRGELHWENGDKFKGLFVDGVRDGPGTLWVHDGFIYEGNWKNDQFNGYGVLKYPSGYVYAGYFQNGRSHGQGKCEFPGGDKYEGDWYAGLMDGLGRYRHKQNGDVYEGMFRKGKRDGPGQYHYKNIRTDVIRYSSGERVGEGVRWSKDCKKAWLLSGTEVIGKLSKEAAMKMQDRICGADIKIMDDRVLLHYHVCAIHTSPIRNKVVQQRNCNIPCMPNFQT